MKALSREEFAAALKKGLGRAWWHVAEHGLDDVADLVLEACLHNQTYDVQCESSRAAWLFEMFSGTGHYAAFRAAILSALQTENEDWDVGQLCRLTKAMAAKGDERARKTLKEFVFDKASHRADDDSLGAEEWLELAGVEGVIDLARIYGQRLITNPDETPSDYLGWSNEIESAYQAALLQQAKTDPAIAAYCKYLEAHGAFTPRQPVDREAARQQTRQRIREQSTLNQILDEAKNGVGEYPGRYTTFGRYATLEELETVYTTLLATMDYVARVRLLWVFRRAPLPRLADVFLDWATADNEELRSAAIEALAGVTDARVHALAREKIANGHLTGADREVLDLFLHNYHSEDAQLIASALSTVELEADWDAHSLSWSLIDLGKNHAGPELIAALRWAYENNPCTNCRYEIVKLLDHFGALEDTLLQECLHDAEEDTRAIAQQRLNASPREAPLS